MKTGTFTKQKKELTSEEQITIRISVRNLVEFILRSGDLDHRRSGADKEAMQMGSRIHRKIQRRMGSSYDAEVSLKYEVSRERFHIIIEGRADGIIKEESAVVVDEIKAVYRDIHLMSNPVPMHLAQAKCYACIYAMEHKLEEITVRMTYCQMQTEEIKYFYETYKTAELNNWFSKVIEEYEKWAAFQADWNKERTESIEKIRFPFTYRKQQKELIAGVYRTIQNKKRLFMQASTGVGKTISVIYPAIQAMGQGMADKIFYLTAKTITRTVAIETFELLKKQNLQMKSIVITAKEKVCFCEEAICNPEYCPYAKGHFDRVNDCVYDLLQKENMITTDVILQYAREYRVCPYELSLDVSVWTDAIICDYNYVFDYDICLKRFFAENNKEQYVFLIDEAHNLVERGRDMYSAVLYKEELMELRKDIKLYNKKLYNLLDKANKIMLEWKKSCVDYEKMTIAEVGRLVILLSQLMTEMDSFLEVSEDEELKQKVLDVYFTVRKFLNTFDRANDQYVVYKQYSEEGFFVRLFCVNPSGDLNNFLEKGRSAVFFSATLLPVKYYMRLLSGQTDDYTMYVPSSFPKENRQIFLGTDVSSRYTRRNKREYEKISKYIQGLVASKSGNYMVFFPSYSYMQSVYEIFIQENPDVSVLVQESVMTELQREEFLCEFQVKRKQSMVAFCVLGGIFSEGIDLKKEQLIGAIIVGSGIPQIGIERELLKQYFDETQGAGFEYAYRYPGFNKVLQAAGRVIRTEEDKGIIVLLEERLMEEDYYGLFPREWTSIEPCRINEFQEKIDCFWKNIR